MQQDDGRISVIADPQDMHFAFVDNSGEAPNWGV